jgi:ATP-binding protein involved in chromosome partitioning
VAARAATMAQKTSMRLLGVVENMSGGVFGSGGGLEFAAALGTDLLGSVPLDGALCQAGDDGRPVVLADPESESAHAITEIAARIAATARERGLGQVVRPLPVVS